MTYDLQTEKQKQTAALALEIEKNLGRLEGLNALLKRCNEHATATILEYLEMNSFNYDIARDKFVKARQDLTKAIENENRLLEELRAKQRELEKTP